MLSRLVIAFLRRNKCLLISWLSPSAVILEPKKIKFVTVSIVFPSIHHEVILVFWMLSFKPTLSLSFTFIKSLFSSSLLSAIKWKSLSCVWHLWPHGLYSPQNSPGQNTGVGSLSLLQGIFPTQELNRGLLHCRQILYQLSYQESQIMTSLICGL